MGTVDGVDVLRLAVKIERTAGDIYRLLHTRFIDDEVASAIWHTMAVEEDSHVDFLITQQRMLEKVPDAFGDINCDISGLEDALKSFESIAERFRSGKDVTLEEAVETAVSMEVEMLESEYFGVMGVASPKLRAVFEALTIDIETHREHLYELKNVVKSRGEKK